MLTSDKKCLFKNIFIFSSIKIGMIRICMCIKTSPDEFGITLVTASLNRNTEV